MDEIKVYVPHAESSWVRASVIKSLGKGKYIVIIDGIDDNGEPGEAPKDPDASPFEIDLNSPAYSISTDKLDSLPLQNLDVPMEGVPDMTSLNYLHEPGILFNLRRRFFNSLPYTYTGDIVVAVNPYRWLDLYNDSIADSYTGILPGNRNSLPPHVYSTSAIAYHGLCKENESQSILVSGESGAGKTETVKILMSHLATIARAHSNINKYLRAKHNRTESFTHLSKDGKALESDDTTIKKIIESNPLLESFGNAKTSRNDNSSRFGKFTQLQFNRHFAMVGSKCTTYLLEKSRVVGHGQGERSYHIFYQLLAAPESEKRKFGLSGKTAKNFGYITADGLEEKAIIEGKSDAVRYDMTCKALDVIGVPSAQRYELFSALAGVIQLGQIMFVAVPDDEDSCAVDDVEVLLAPCAQLGIEDTNDLERALCNRTVRVRGEAIQTPNRPDIALGMRDAMAKTLYCYLFDWLVKQVNDSTSSDESASGSIRSAKYSELGTIALLDIFGFESFTVNRFEQLCINYANEKLQQKFTQDIFKTVQLEYEAEHIPWAYVDFTDNAEVLWLLESTTGILAVLNEECMLGKGSDERYTSKLTKLHEDHPNFSRNRLNKLNFGVKHYAGMVYYCAEGFLEKNKDSLGEDAFNILTESTSSLISQIFSVAPITPPLPLGKLQRSKSSAALSTLSSKFKTSLNELMEIIRRTNVQYVRCIKPNSSKSPVILENSKVVEQLRCAGVIEAIRISRTAYPNRISHLELIKRFSFLLDPGTRDSYAKKLEESNTSASVAKQLCTPFLSQLLGKNEKGFEVGLTRVYFRFGVLEKLEQRRLAIEGVHVTQLQALLRMCMCRRRFYRIKIVTLMTQANYRRYIAQQHYIRTRYYIILVQCQWRRIVAMRKLAVLRFERASSKIASVYLMHKAMVSYTSLRNSAIKIQAIVRMVMQKKHFKVMLVEAKQAQKLESQIVALQARLKREQEARKKVEAQSRELAAKLADQTKRMNHIRQGSTSVPKDAAMNRNGSKEDGLLIASPTPLRSASVGGLWTPSTSAAVLKFFKEEKVHNETSLDMLDESQQIMATMKEEIKKLREQNEALREENTELKREKQRVADISGIGQAAIQQNLKKLIAQNKNLIGNLTHEKSENLRLHDVIKNKLEEQNVMKKVYDNEVIKRKAQLKVMQNLVHLVADATTPLDNFARDELANQMAGMYQACVLQEEQANGENVVSPEPQNLMNYQDVIINNVSYVGTALRFALFGKPRWGAAYDE